MRFLSGLLTICFLATAHAHVVPNMTIEADFAKDHSYTLRINLDPRVFLSDQPTSLPPVTADWYLGQSDAQKQETYAKATDYLKANVGLGFAAQTLAVPPCEFVAMDGATNEPIKAETAETHLLATAKGQVPAGADSFKIIFGKTANVSLILLNSEEGNNEKRPQVIFPGETSRPFSITKAPEAAADNQDKDDIKLTEVSVEQGVMIGGSFVPVRYVLLGGIGVAALFAVFWALVMRSKRR